MTVCNHEQKELWNTLIGKDDDIYYHWAYSDSFYQVGSGIPTLFYLSDGRTRIYTVLMIRKISDLEPFGDFVGYHDVATPYGYGGTVVKGFPNGQLLEQFFDEMSAQLRSLNVVAEYSRLDPVSGNVGLYGGQPYDCNDFTKTVCMRLESAEQVFADMKGTSRNHIRKAIENKITVTSGFDDSYLDIFRNIYNETMARRNANSYYYFNDAFYSSILSGLNGKAKFYVAWYQGLPISSTIMLYSAGNATYHLGGTVTEYMKLGANNQLIYEATKDLITMGVKTLLLGGGYGGTEDSLFQFKKTLAPAGIQNCHAAKRIYDKETYDKLVSIKQSLRTDSEVNRSYFPAYRG